MEVTLAGVDLKTLSYTTPRMSMLLWGPPGAGKTVFACSAPGKKLLVNFDPDGPSSLGAREDVILADLSSMGHSITTKFSDDDPFRFSRILSDESVGIGTVVVDSATAFAQLGVERGISITKGATIERPSPGAYGARNALTLRMINAMLRQSAKYGKHIIITTHEDAPEKDDNGNVLFISLLLGGKLSTHASLQISEVWHIADTDKGRRIMVRPGRMRQPMKTRMFNTGKEVEFICQYDQFGPDAPYGKHSLASFIEEWTKNGYNKIPLPK